MRWTHRRAGNVALWVFNGGVIETLARLTPLPPLGDAGRARRRRCSFGWGK